VPDPALALEGVGRRYGEREALSGVTLELAPGQTLGVFGPNGAGKTTLLRVLATLLRPHSGAARVLGAELPNGSWQVRGKVGYLAHEPLLYRDLSVRDNLRFHARLHGLSNERVDEVIEQVDLTRRANDALRDLSKGLVQRAAVARAVLHDPPLLLLDEPRANLDPGAAKALESLIGRPSGRTRVVVSHDVEGTLAESDLALGLKDGRQAFATTSVTAQQVRELYA
jgi:ABC-type multidrug transport system ATPase subunit